MNSPWTVCVVSRSRRQGATLALALALGVAWSAVGRADNLDKALLAEAPKVMEYLQKQGKPTVGVLRFRFEKEKQGASFHVGEINANMADRLENALVLLNDSKNPISILRDPTAVAGKSRGATYQTEKGRRTLLDTSFPLAWGDKTAKPDILLTGDVKLSADNKTTTVQIKAFSAKKNEFALVHQFQVKTDRGILSDCSRSFSIANRGARGEIELDAEAVASATTNETAPPATPTDKDGDVRLGVLYEGTAVTLDADPGSRGSRAVRFKPRNVPAGTAVGPLVGQKVSLTIENTSPDQTYAVVVKVNGVNTLFEETKDSADCTKWILAPAKDGKPTRFEIKGFYTDEKGTYNPFKVLTDEETKKAEELGGNDLGLIEFCVFASGPPQTAMQISERKLSLKKKPTKGKARSLEDVKADLAQESHVKLVNGKLVADPDSIKKVPPRGATVGSGARLLLGKADGTETGGPLERVSFENPVQIKCLAVRYHVVTAAGK